jgi:hypothetical protein
VIVVRDRDSMRRWLLSVHVADWDRWTRAKRIAAVLCWAIALGAIGGTEWDPATPDTANYGLFIIAIVACAALMWSLERRRG